MQITSGAPAAGDGIQPAGKSPRNSMAATAITRPNERRAVVMETKTPLRPGLFRSPARMLPEAAQGLKAGPRCVTFMPHKASSRRAARKLHCDGTLEALGNWEKQRGSI